MSNGKITLNDGGKFTFSLSPHEIIEKLKEIITENTRGVRVLDKGETIWERYDEEIHRFFREEFFFVQNKKKGHVWIAGRWRTFQVLTIEPPEGGQYEIAVRFGLQAGHPDADAKYSGYLVSGDHLVGQNTDGH